METIASNRSVGFQLMVNKKIQSVPNLVGERDNEVNKDYMAQGNFTYNRVKSLDGNFFRQCQLKYHFYYSNKRV
ncbi:hypothetical protein [Aequorivita sediminis]|uniref:hypothetical protein n=1 Tax=Aequorivita sediminis TaxID=3073653 RepID=UPI0028B00050|nr:hypothetical protein [Aequorivita sp. F6058]